MKLLDRKLHICPGGGQRFRNPELRNLEWDFTDDLIRGVQVDTPPARRVVKLLERMQRADVIQEQLIERNPKVVEWYRNQQHEAFEKYKAGRLRDFPDFEAMKINFRDAVSRALYDELVQLCAKLRKMLRQYRWGPTAHLNVVGLSYYMDYGTCGGPREWENWCVENIIEFHFAGLLPLFRPCRQCRTWLFSLSEHQKYCSSNCRQKFASKSHEFKVNRRIYMQNYRKRERERDQQARKLVKRGGIKLARN